MFLKDGTLQVGIRAQLERIRHTSVCFDLKFAALNIFQNNFFQLNERNEKMFENRKRRRSVYDQSWPRLVCYFIFLFTAY